MSTTYKVTPGDTFESIARKTYGIDSEGTRIFNANPGTFQPLLAGTTLTIPDLPVIPIQTVAVVIPVKLPASVASDNPDEVAVIIDGKVFRFWNSVRITRSIDSMDTVEFGTPFDSEAPGFRETFRPCSFKSVVITVGGVPLFTGTMVAINPLLENSELILSVSGYSLPGVLNDCTPPVNAELEFNDQGLNDIAVSLSSSFGISVNFQANQGSTFERVASGPSETVLSFLTKLAKQRNLIISSSSKGELTFLKSSDIGQPVAILEQGFAPVLSVVPMFNPQEYYSHITGVEPVATGGDGSQFTVKNPRLNGVIRPLSFTVPDTPGADVKNAVEAKVGRMFGNVASYSIRVDTWRDPSGNLWQPNTTVKLLAPGAMIYNSYEFIIRSVEFNRSRASETATLNLVIPGAFSGKIPESLPWDA